MFGPQVLRHPQGRLLRTRLPFFAESAVLLRFLRKSVLTEFAGLEGITTILLSFCRHLTFVFSQCDPTCPLWLGRRHVMVVVPFVPHPRAMLYRYPPQGNSSATV